MTSYPEVLQSDETRAFWDYIQVLCAQARPPRAADFELMDIYNLASYVALVDLIPAEDRMRVRYVGTRIVEMFDQETTGKYLDELDIGPHTDELLDMYRKSFSEVRPHWSLADVHMTRDEGYGYMRPITFSCERLMFPMVDEDGAVTRLAAVLSRQDRSSVLEEYVCEALDFPNGDKADDRPAASRV